jgi:hypothetical protein
VLHRFDVGTLSNVEKTPQGGLRIAAHLTRSGVFHYDDGKGGTIAEYRPLDEVSHADSIATLSDAPVTVGHPGMVTPDNHAKNAAGHVRDVKMDGERVGATVVIQGRKAIRAVEKGVRQVSCGYTCRVDEEPGITPDGTRYDRVQRGIRYNHVALVEKGRAGDDIRLRLDAAGNQQPTREDNMEFERIDGVKYEVGTEAHAAALKSHDSKQKEAQKKYDDALAATAVVQAKFDAAEAKRADAEKKLAEATDVKRLDEAVAARSSLLDRARLVLGSDAKLDGMTERQIHERVVAKASPAIKLEGRSDDAMSALFEAFTGEGAKERADAAAVGATRAAIISVSREDERPNPDKAREEMIKRNNTAWKNDAANGVAK